MEIRDAQHVLIRNHQMVHVKERYRKELTKNPNLKENEVKVLRAYGRLNKAELSAAAENPTFTAPYTALSRLLIQEAHGAFHKGTAHTMAEVRQTYWIPRLREQTKREIRCRRMHNSRISIQQ
ncbi:hypothetical protein Q1695_003420 [Nippostrongylus brasiliensis]|nr:hypothetical protein Q1695_003420 [Nippostrongylus brasiliensis]